ncbi:MULTISPECIES: Crp/Fnr family transcriptional regulator [Thermoactinomyces]|jgi:CRP/FNR family transcriptional regulator, cyclic AMP receptor protein|uniref:Crp/Fnr family transcriptional regulator n=1 Tax=Thermoactinomyces daqus TaxID=1329516 RepID=A0A7W1XBI7_9BACL|nr:MULTISPECIES: Crp/Fnr family transcriptional regulator [Thermoactinomyces]MBA4543621.1 Crp/Fnr family transcriptional regulator [Thermoactinomyces daqus]MBH8603278.1 Crp/Fnr family transcriptional regulator [Thermoactinomyces sp. CICC 10522]MBH8609026.1 Crp/Fnr family transcriptional regulator [Thermoactinomyces sp. CICC 10521]
MDHKFEVVKRVPVFSGLNEEELKKVSGIAFLRHYRKHSTVFTEGQERSAVYFIHSGIIKVTKVDNNGNEQVICLLPKGEMFPHVGFFDDIPYPGTAQTVTDCELLAIPLGSFNQLLSSNPQIAKSVMKMMDKRLLQMQRRLHGVISGDIHRKMIVSLLQLVEEYGNEKDGGVYISIPLTNQDFANMLGMSRESVNRVLNQLKKDQLLEISRKGIFIYNLDALKSLLSSS